MHAAAVNYQLHSSCTLLSRTATAVFLLIICCESLGPGVLAQPPGMRFCLDNDTNATSGQSMAPQNNSDKIIARQRVQSAIGRDVGKVCLTMLLEMEQEGNYFYVLEVNQSAILESEACSDSEDELSKIVSLMNWEVALRSKNRNRPLFNFPIKPGQWVLDRPEISGSLQWRPVNTLPNKDELCVTRSGQLRFLQFKPEMAGTYAIRPSSGLGMAYNSMRYRVLKSLSSIYHHVDFVYDSLEYFERNPVRQKMPPLSPKASTARMFSSEPNLRYQYRSSPDLPKPGPMEALESNNTIRGARFKFRFPPKLFKNLTIQMMWTPPPELNQFSSWTPKCGTKIVRMRFMKCAIDLDLARLIKRLGEYQNQLKLQRDYDGLQRQLFFSEGHGLSMLWLLHSLARRLKVQLLDEAREVSAHRPLYSAGFFWTKTREKKDGTVELLSLRIPCHYTLLHHLPNLTVKEEGMASLEVYKIENTGEREQAVRPCGFADPLELLRMMGEVLVAQLRRLVNMVSRRPIVPQRSVVSRGKTLYMKCPVDLFAFEKPACNLPDRDDNIIWTLNGKTMRFFPAKVERGPSLTDECGLTVKQIQMNDAGEYVCYRTLKGSHVVEDTPAFRHFVNVVRPDFDPPPVEEVYFGMAVCIVWSVILLLIWSVIAIILSFLRLLNKEPESPVKPEVWTSFFDDDPTLDDLDEDDDEEEDEEEEDDEDDDEDEEEGKKEMKSFMRQPKSAPEEPKADSADQEETTGSNRGQHNRHRWGHKKLWGKKKRD